MSAAMNLREDWRAIKEIALKDFPMGHDKAVEWSRAPLVDLSGWITTIGVNAKRSAMAIPGVFSTAPWDNAVYMIRRGLYMRAYRIDAPGWPERLFLAYERSSTTGRVPNERNAIMVEVACDTGIVFAAVLDDESGLPCIVLQKENFETADGSAAQDDKMRTLLTILLESVQWLSGTDMYPVAVAPVATLSDRDRKTAAKKPWLRTDTPRVILLDPTAARMHGHGAGRGGTHASPRIHQRRGHWNTLRHEKFQRNEDGTHRRVWASASGNIKATPIAC